MTCRCHVTMVIVSPPTGVIPFPNGLFMASKWGGYYLLTNWEDPPSSLRVHIFHRTELCGEKSMDSKKIAAWERRFFKYQEGSDLLQVARHKLIGVPIILQSLSALSTNPPLLEENV